MGLEYTLKDSFDGLEKELLKAMTDIIEETSQEILDRALLLVPVREGDLKASIHIATGEDNDPEAGHIEREVIAGTGLPDARAIYNEYGTGQRGEAGNQYTLQDGSSPTYKSSWAGMSPQPYMTPASEAARPEFVNKFEHIEERLR